MHSRTPKEGPGQKLETFALGENWRGLGFPPAYQQDAEEPLEGVILSEANNLGSCEINELRRSFVACGSPG